MAKYDQRVHKAMMEMVSSFSAEMASMKIPFFCIDPSLVSEESEVSVDFDSKAKEPKGITDLQLRELKKRMIQFLEDMYKE